MKRKLMFVLLILFILITLQASLELVGRAMPGEPEATFVADSICYVVAYNVLQLFNVSDPTNPLLICNVNMPDVANDIYVYLALM